MKSLFNFNNFFYSIILTIVFFNGFDSSLLYNRTFLDGHKYTTFEYGHFFFSLLGGWFIGYFLIKKIVQQYNPNYIFRVSLLIASLSIWIQYKTEHLSMDKTFNKLIIDNLFCSVLLGLLSYSLIMIFNQKNELSTIKKQKNYSILILLLGIFYSFVLTEEKIQSGFLLSSLIYFLSYLYFLKNSIHKLDYETTFKPIIPMIIAVIIILASITLVYFKTLESFKFYSEEVYPIFIYIAFLFFEGILQNKNKTNIIK